MMDSDTANLTRFPSVGICYILAPSMKSLRERGFGKELFVILDQMLGAKSPSGTENIKAHLAVSVWPLECTQRQSLGFCILIQLGLDDLSSGAKLRR